MRRGVSLVEVLVVVALLGLVLVVVYGVYFSGERLYQNESVVRDAQVYIRHLVEQMGHQIEETDSPSTVWSFDDPTIPGEPKRDNVRLILSARDPDDPNTFSGIHATDVRSAPIMSAVTWRMLVLYAPSRDAKGVIQLWRYPIVLQNPTTNNVPASVGASFSSGQFTITVDAAAYVIDRAAGTVTLTLPGGQVLIWRGAMIVDELSQFEIAPITTSGVDGSPGPLSNTLSVTLARTVKVTPRITTEVSNTATALVRNP